MKEQFPDMFMAVLMALLFLLLQIVVAVFAMAFFGSQGLMLLAGVTIPALIIVFIARFVNKTSFEKTIHWDVVRGGKVLSIILMTLTAAVLASELENIIADYVIPPEIYSKLTEYITNSFVMENQGDKLLGMVALTIFGPLMEEALFRGVIYRAVAANRGALMGIIVSSFIFMFVHINPLQFPAALSLGVVYAAMLSRGYSISDTFLSHALFNTFSAFFLFGIIEYPGMSLTQAGEVVHVPLFLVLVCLVLFVASLLVVLRKSSNSA